MKKKTLRLCLLAATSICFGNNVNGQAWTTGSTGQIVTNGSTNNVLIDGTKKLLINTVSAPSSLPGSFTLNANIDFEDEAAAGWGAYRHIWGKNKNHGLALFAADGWTTGAGILMNGDDNASNPGSLHLICTAPATSTPNNEIGFGFADGSSWSRWLSITKAGRIGINTDVPEIASTSNPLNGDDIITVNGDFGFKTANHFRGIRGRSDDAGLAIYANTAWGNGAGVLFSGNNATSRQGSMTFVATEAVTPSVYEIAASFVTSDPTGSWSNPLMNVYKNGKVQIGTVDINTAGVYKLYVQDGILTEKLKVAIAGTANWADYVFADDYKLKSLDEVQSFINDNKHLPGIPSAQEVVKDGIDVATMDAKLLQKIEELTLYVIQQQKEINELKTQMRK